MKIGEYIICKNELKHLDAGLKELIKLDDICILDTGSTDGTYERLLELEKIHPNIHVRQKTYDVFYFDVARNDALDFAAEYFEENDGLFTLDLDEYASEGFVDKVRKQLEETPLDINMICLKDQDNFWHWQGHRYHKKYRWFFHVHEMILDSETKKEPAISLFLHDVSYFHNQDLSKPRGYNKMLRNLIQSEPDEVHYLIMGLSEERNGELDEDFLESLRVRAIYQICNRQEDTYYKDMARLAGVCEMIADKDIDIAIDALQNEEKALNQSYNQMECRRFHLVLARLMRRRGRKEDFIKIETEYYKALFVKSDLGWWVEKGCDDKSILLDFIMFLFYEKKDTISAAFYSKKLKDLEESETNVSNYNICAELNTYKKSGILLLTSNNYIDGIITTIKTLQTTETKFPISVIVTNDICIENMAILLSLGVCVFIVDKIKPLNTDIKEVQLADIEDLEQPGFHPSLSKFYIYDLVFFEKAVYLDSDIGVLKNIDDLFDKEEGSAILDGCGFYDLFCTCLLVIKPNHQTYKDIIDFFHANYNSSETFIHDQEVLQQYFKNHWYSHPELKLPLEYCMGSTYYESNLINYEYGQKAYYFNLFDVKSYHMVFKKPWTHGRKFFEEYYISSPCYASLMMRYIDLINYCVKQVQKSGYTSPFLTLIQ